MNPELSIIIVSHNTATLTRGCIDGLIGSREVQQKKWELLVIDNASVDGSKEMLRALKGNVSVIFNDKNVGFAKANNQGIVKAKGSYILLLNSDTVATPHAINATLTYFKKDQSIGVITCAVRLPNGALDPASHRGFPTPWNSFTYMSGLEKLLPKVKLFSGYHMGYKSENSIHEIDSPSGAFYMLRRAVIDEVGLLDEDYFMYGEDIDWSYRIKKSGWKIVYYPVVSIIHEKKASGRASDSAEKRRDTRRHFYETMKLFYKKHYERVYPFFVTWLVYTVIDAKRKLASYI